EILDHGEPPCARSSESPERAGPGALRREKRPRAQRGIPPAVGEAPLQERSGMEREKGKGDAPDMLGDLPGAERRRVSQRPGLDEENLRAGRESRRELLRSLPETAPGNITEPDDVPVGTHVSL